MAVDVLLVMGAAPIKEQLPGADGEFVPGVEVLRWGPNEDRRY